MNLKSLEDLLSKIKNLKGLLINYDLIHNNKRLTEKYIANQNYLKTHTHAI